jgi:hypothetical protein
MHDINNNRPFAAPLKSAFVGLFAGVNPQMGLQVVPALNGLGAELRRAGMANY